MIAHCLKHMGGRRKTQLFLDQGSAQKVSANLLDICFPPLLNEVIAALMWNISQSVMEAKRQRLPGAPATIVQAAFIAESSQLVAYSPWQTMALPGTTSSTSGWHRRRKQDLNRALPWTLAVQRRL